MSFTIGTSIDRIPYMMQHAWREIEHTADTGLEVEGGTMEELFRNAADGMIALMLEPGGVDPRVRRGIAAEGPDAESLLVGWLEEILYLFDAENVAPRRTADLRIEKDRVAGEIEGERFDTARHNTVYGIKAVTWHELKIKEENGIFRVRIIFDV